MSFPNAYSFSTVYQFIISNNTGSISDSGGGPVGAEGLVFIIQAQNNAPTSSDFRLAFQYLPTSFGVEIDTFFNPNIDPNNDGNHLAILEGGDLIARSYYSVTSDYFNNGEVWTVWVDYDSVTQVASASVVMGQNAVRPSSPQTNYSTYLTNIIGVQLSAAYVGFGAGVGADASVHEVISWKFRNEYYPYGICSAGYIYTGSTCYECLAGQYSLQDDYCCSTCPAGTFSSAGSGSCSSCPSYQYSSSGSSQCQSKIRKKKKKKTKTNKKQKKKKKKDCTCQNGVCDQTTGLCTSCNTGFTGSNCDSCQTVFFFSLFSVFCFSLLNIFLFFNRRADTAVLALLALLVLLEHAIKALQGMELVRVILDLLVLCVISAVQ